jgi:hypothetical protein
MPSRECAPPRADPYVYSEFFDRNEGAPDRRRAVRGDARALNALDPLGFDWDQDYKLVERFGDEKLYALDPPDPCTTPEL